jgi:hypothetical protein
VTALMQQFAADRLGEPVDGVHPAAKGSGRHGTGTPGLERS